ncbi:MAG: hypothetical protein ABW171_08745 [Steroidobacter sp.]
MELTYLLLMGSLSGLVGVLGHSVIYSLVELIRSRGTEMGSIEFSDAFLHLVCGTGLGLLFWLSWGLAGLVEVPWWVRGLTFAALCWVPISLPAMLNAWLSSRELSTKMMIAMTSRWALTCLVAGLTCAWSWERSV